MNDPLFHLLDTIARRQESYYGNHITINFALDHKLIAPKDDIKFHGFVEGYSLTIYGKWMLFRWHTYRHTKYKVI